MTLEERAKAIADRSRNRPGSYTHREIEAFALRMLRAAVADGVQEAIKNLSDLTRR